jgi:hypothetical protein
VTILPASAAHLGQEGAPVAGAVRKQPESQPESLDTRVLRVLERDALGKKTLSIGLGQKEISGQLNKTIRVLLADQSIEYTIPGNPTAGCRSTD